MNRLAQTLMLSMMLAIHTTGISARETNSESLKATGKESSIAKGKESTKDTRALSRPAKSTRIKAWRLDQPGDYMGQRVTYISPDGYLSTYTKGHYSMVASAPDWAVTYYNSDRKLIYTQTMEEWRKSFGSRAKLFRDTLYPESYKVKPGPHTKILGHPVSTFVLTTTKPVDDNSIAKSVIYLGDELVLPKAMSNFFAITWGKELSTHQMMRIEVTMGGGYKATKLDTKSMQQVEVDKQFFTCPTGYKQAQSESQVTLGSGLINDIVDDLGKQLGTDKK